MCVIPNPIGMVAVDLAHKVMGRVAEDCVIPSSACFGGYISIAEMYLCESCVCFHIVHTVYNTIGFAHAIMLITQTCIVGNPKKNK